MKLSHLAALAVTFIPAILSAQSSDSIGQRGRTLIALNLGLTGKREASASASALTARGTGQVASLGVTHFVHPSVGIEFNAAVLDEDNYVKGTRAHNEGVTSLLFGINYSPAELALNAVLRPFVSVAAGPYLHSLNDASPATGVSSSLTAVLGGRVGAGASWYVTRHVALQLEGDYHAVPGFEATDGVRRSVSGFALSVGAGFAWGGSAPR